MSDRVLYQSGTSVCSQKVRLVLEELGLQWRGVTLNLAQGDQFAPDYQAINPNSVVPTLVEDGRVFVESNTIMVHLVNGHESALLPGDSEGRERVSRWLARSLDLHDAVNTLTQLAMNRARLLALSDADRADRLAKIPVADRRSKLAGLIDLGYEAPDVARAVDIMEQATSDMDGALRSADWLAGDGFSLADAAVFPFFNRLALLRHQALWTDQADRIDRWRVAIMARQSFETAVAEFHPPAVCEKFSKNGRVGFEQLKRVISSRPA